MIHYLITALRLTAITVLLVGVIYPLVITGLAQVLFPVHANGSLVREGTLVRGSALIGQSFTRAEYFHPRPSAAGNGYDPLSSGGSNLGPTSKALSDRVSKDVTQIQHETPALTTVPVDMVTTSGSGLDPDITPANALAQVPRVAHARGIPAATLQQLVAQSIIPRQFGFLGEARVNVLQLNRLLDANKLASH